MTDRDDIDLSRQRGRRKTVDGAVNPVPDGTRHVLVTGGAGFAGSHIAIGLRYRNPELSVTALDNLKRRGSELNLPRLRDAGVRFVHGDIRNCGDFEPVGPADLVVECSAEPSVLAGLGESPRYLIDTNLNGTVNCLEFARVHGAAVIFLSTSRVYPMAALNALAYRETDSRFVLEDAQPAPGASGRGISEQFPLDGPRSLYGTTKLCSELILREYLDAYGLRGLVNRCGVLTGPWQMGKIEQGVVALWAARHMYGGELSYIGYGGTGKQVRDILHVDDLLDLIVYEMGHLEELNGEVFNVGGGVDSSVSLKELTALCREISGKHIPIAAEPRTRAADVPIYVSDCAKVRNMTGWRPKYTVPDILAEICAWLRDHESALRPILG